MNIVPCKEITKVAGFVLVDVAAARIVNQRLGGVRGWEMSCERRVLGEAARLLCP
jgi:hypothetical protein